MKSFLYGRCLHNSFDVWGNLAAEELRQESSTPLSFLPHLWTLRLDKGKYGPGAPQQGTPQLQILLDIWDTSLENACPAPLEKKVCINPQNKALRVNKRFFVINPVARAYLLGLTAIFSFQAKLRHGLQGTTTSESGDGAMILLSWSSKLLCQLPIRLYRYCFLHYIQFTILSFALQVWV